MRIAQVACGTVELDTSYSTIETRVRESVVTWLDVNSGHGQARKTLTASETRRRSPAVSPRGQRRRGFPARVRLDSGNSHGVRVTSCLPR
ncbi:hypothetical protein [Streptomyces sp. NEAU-YJ-81]|uniref:hypothetical protein n=1 Tax=Streptomyces sp. NEAU-YJ-81 TaxID=2820288 RepID=UPI001ABC989A|nr:hypothetical protein [Streptomyces sp. NEAU-YJ-81]MBO3676150.1 hypothetical protein [Streptomyces sp. NEAU-YJ-81]